MVLIVAVSTAPKEAKPDLSKLTKNQKKNQKKKLKKKEKRQQELLELQQQQLHELTGEKPEATTPTPEETDKNNGELESDAAAAHSSEVPDDEAVKEVLLLNISFSHVTESVGCVKLLKVC